MATPITTPLAYNMLEAYARLPLTVTVVPSTSEVDEFHAHLQTLCGTAVDPSTPPVVFTAGLPAIAALWATLINRGGADVLMCSTAYGGSSQMTDIMVAKSGGLLRKEAFHIQGNIFSRQKHCYSKVT